MEQKTMMPTMTPTMMPDNAHKDIPGNPSTAKSSFTTLNNRSSGEPLHVLSEADWNFWITNGYIVIKNAVQENKHWLLQIFYGSLKKKTPIMLILGTHRHVQK
jgi:hypothetical protein